MKAGEHVVPYTIQTSVISIGCLRNTQSCRRGITALDCNTPSMIQWFFVMGQPITFDKCGWDISSHTIRRAVHDQIAGSEMTSLHGFVN